MANAGLLTLPLQAHVNVTMVTNGTRQQRKVIMELTLLYTSCSLGTERVGAQFLFHIKSAKMYKLL